MSATVAPPLLLDIKSTCIDVFSLVVHQLDLDALTIALSARMAKRPKELDEAAFVVDASSISTEALLAQLPAFFMLMRSQPVRIMGLRHRDPAVAEAVRGLGWAWFPATREKEPVTEAQPPAAEPTLESTVTRVVEQVVVNVPTRTVLVDKPVRAGQQIYARDGDLVVLALVSPGAELIADGNIHIYGTFRGKALAGARGNPRARIFIQSVEAELVSIAGVYRTFAGEAPYPTNVPSQVYLEGEKLVVAALHE